MARRRTRSSTPFRAWGTLLFVALLLTLNQGSWKASAVVASVLLFYLLAVRLTICRVETLKHRPCRWRVRGYLSCCDYHLGLKGSLPSLVRVRDRWLPRWMWLRDDLAITRPEPQPESGGASVAPNARRWSPLDRIMVLLAVGSLLVAIMSFVRDVIAG